MLYFSVNFSFRDDSFVLLGFFNSETRNITSGNYEILISLMSAEFAK